MILFNKKEHPVFTMSAIYTILINWIHITSSVRKYVTFYTTLFKLEISLIVDIEFSRFEVILTFISNNIFDGN